MKCPISARRTCSSKRAGTCSVMLFWHWHIGPVCVLTNVAGDWRCSSLLSMPPRMSSTSPLWRAGIPVGWMHWSLTEAARQLRLDWRMHGGQKEPSLTKANDANHSASFLELDCWIIAPAWCDLIPGQSYYLPLASRALKSISSNIFRPTAAAWSRLKRPRPVKSGTNMLIKM